MSGRYREVPFKKSLASAVDKFRMLQSNTVMLVMANILLNFFSLQNHLKITPAFLENMH